MPRPVKWSRDLHSIRERALRSKTETWSRLDIEHLFEIRRASAQTLMKAIGEVQVVGGTHFVDRGSLLGFLDEMVQANSVEDAMRQRLEVSMPLPRPAPIRIALPATLRRLTVADLPENVALRQGEVRITGPDAETIVEGLVVLAQVMQNDLENVRQQLDPPQPPAQTNEDLRELFAKMRRDTRE